MEDEDHELLAHVLQISQNRRRNSNYWEKLRQDPERYKRILQAQKDYRAKRKKCKKGVLARDISVKTESRMSTDRGTCDGNEAADVEQEELEEDSKLVIDLGNT
jgi:hypothetical protein